jgi:NADP-dependent 3-hydroxy acid dehydrogenase YdfG
MIKQSLSEKVIVLTGASSGFGRGAALAFAKAGASLVLAARSIDSLNEIAAECQAAGARTLVVPADV